MKHLAVLLVVVLSFATCKKGVDDPPFTLKSRTKRLTGDWTLSSGRASLTLSSYNNLYTLSPTSLVMYTTYTGGIPTSYYGNYRLTVSIMKDNTFSFSENYAGTITEAKGTWEFRKANGDLKNKESVQFKINAVTRGKLIGYSLFNQNSDSFIYCFRELSDKRITMYNSGKTDMGFNELVDYSVDYTMLQR